jgi:ATP-dependent exoDNAse (exonuclease V) alpha subunit
MAIFRLEAKIIGRKTRTPGKAVSVVAKAAYRAGQSLRDDKADKTFNYRSRAQEVAFSEIMVPANAPDWLKQPVPETDAGTKKQRDMRQELWNTIEKVEKRKDSQLAREFVVALPRELNREQQIELLRGWCQSEFTGKGIVADVCLHKSKNNQNPHAHILCPTRPLTADGFGKKPDTAGKFNGRGAAGMGAKTELDGWRESWEKHANAALEKSGSTARVDHRSLKERGIKQEPQPKIGAAANAMQKKGIDTDKHRKLRMVQLWNEIRPSLKTFKQRGVTPQLKLRGMGKTWWEQSLNLASRTRESLTKAVHTIQKVIPSRAKGIEPGL